ncbi:Cell death protease [Lobulomyces angularis]|nr:Cell death protease [Lobulomyces angularis]
MKNFVIFNILILIVFSKSSVQKRNVLSAAEYYIKSLPGLSQEDFDLLIMHSGHINVEESRNANVFFWLVQHHHKLNKSHIVIWLNGGPGCSSMDGMFLESGAFRLLDNGNLALNNYSWYYDADLLFVDQPVNTGFSYSNAGGTPKSQPELVKDFILFLELFFQIFPQLKRSEIIIAGESFAGTYIPYIGDGILKDKNNNFKLKSLLIGNGWIDPLRQYESYIPFGLEKNLLGEPYLSQAKKIWENCKKHYEQKNTIKDNVCEGILEKMLDFSRANGKMCINMYDIRLHDEGPNDGCGLFKWPPGLDLLNKYLAREDVIEAIHAGGKLSKWQECSGTVSYALENDKSFPSYTLLPDLLQRIPIILFNGDQDLICNYMGIEAMINELTWNNEKGFGKDSVKKNWFFGEQLLGTYEARKNLTYVKVFNASHMVPVDKGAAGLDILNRMLGVQDVVNGILMDIDLKKVENTTDGAGHFIDNPKEADDNLSFSLSAFIFIFFLIIISGISGIYLYRKKYMRSRGIYRNNGGGAEWHELATNERDEEQF